MVIYTELTVNEELGSVIGENGGGEGEYCWLDVFEFLNETGGNVGDGVDRVEP